MKPGSAFVGFFALVLLQIPAARARPGGVDPSFDPGSSPDFSVFTIAVQPDGKIVIGGEFGSPGNSVARLNTDGSVDKTFNPGTGVNTYDYLVGLSHVYALALQPDEKLVIAGVFATFNGVARNGIARLNPDGSLDLSFDPGTGPGVAIPNIYSVALQPDGKLLVVGSFNSFHGVSRNGVARLNTDGSVDTSFDPGSGAVGFPGFVYSVAVQTNGQVVVGGLFTTFNGTNRNDIARLNADGSLDATFDPGTGPNNAILSMALQPDGKVIIGGQFTTIDGTTRNRIARLNRDGSLDTTFMTTGATGASSDVRSVALQSDGKVLLGGRFTSVNAVSRNRVARLQTDGTVDTGFNPGTGAQGDVFFVAAQSNDAPLIGGSFTSINGVARDYIARLNSDGTVDASFNPGASPAAQVNALARQPDGKVVIGGNFDDVRRVVRLRVARLYSDGTLDEGFDSGTAVHGSSFGSVNALALQTNGQVLVGGSFSSANTVGSNALARLNSDGSLDSSYAPILPIGANIYALALQSDQRAVIAGSFATVNGTSRSDVARLNIDGSLDSSFSPGKGANAAIRAVTLQRDGKMIIGGDFTAFNATNRNSITRLNSDGSLDLTFDPGTGVLQGFPTRVETLV